MNNLNSFKLKLLISYALICFFSLLLSPKGMALGSDASFGVVAPSPEKPAKPAEESNTSTPSTSKAADNANDANSTTIPANSATNPLVESGSRPKTNPANPANPETGSSTVLKKPEMPAPRESIDGHQSQPQSQSPGSSSATGSSSPGEPPSSSTESQPSSQPKPEYLRGY